MYDFFEKILFILFIIGIFYLIFNIYTYDYNLNNDKCNLENFDIDELMVVKRTPENSRLIDKLINEKSFIFNDKQLKLLKNPQQIFKISNNNQHIQNISNMVYNNCHENLSNNLNQELFNNSNYLNDMNNSNVPLGSSDMEYLSIKNKLKNDVESIIEPNSTNTGVLKNNIPFSKNYLKNYYKDLYGNRVESELGDYFTAYYTLINSDDNVGFPVNTQIGHSNFIIPDQYKYDSKFTNAYNIDWSRIINPIGYSM